MNTGEIIKGARQSKHPKNMLVNLEFIFSVGNTVEMLCLDLADRLSIVEEEQKE